MEIYYDILIGIERESKANGLVKRTRVQQHSGLSYDKFSRHLSDMAIRGLVVLNPLSTTEKGLEFVREYNRVRSFMLEIGAKFFDTAAPVRQITQELVSGIPKMSHSVLFYEDRKYADLVAAEYLSRGLEKAESCVYLTSEDPEFVKKRLTDLVGPLREGIRENRLRIYPVYAKNIEKAPSFKAIRKLLENSTRGMKPPFRIFGNIGQPITDAKARVSELSIEKLLHESFHSLGITMLCWYNLAKVPRVARRKLVESTVERHNYVVFASDPSKAFGVDTSLLRTEP